MGGFQMVYGRRVAACGAVVCALALSSAAAASDDDGAPATGRSPGLFARNRVRLTVTAGTSWSANDTYLLLGVGVGYFILDGFEAGLDYEAWLLGDPTLNVLSPEARYVFYFVPTVKPYVGGFYRHTFVSGSDDFDSLGVRAGAIVIPERTPVFLGGGIVYERILSCHSSLVVDCDAVYPELFAGITF